MKCRRQVDAKLYKSNLQAWSTIYRKEGIRGIFFGWSPTFVGYSFQGAGKYGAYEVFKYYYGEKLFPNTPKTIVYLGASATAEFIADLFLCPFEAIKVRMQTTIPPYANNLREGWSNIVTKEGYSGLYKGLYPLWARQIPYTMVKFATFESAVGAIYNQLGAPRTLEVVELGLEPIECLLRQPGKAVVRLGHGISSRAMPWHRLMAMRPAMGLPAAFR